MATDEISECVRALQEKVRTLDTALARARAQIRELKGDVAGLEEERRTTLQSLRMAKGLKKSDDASRREGLQQSAMARADQGMSDADIARAMGRTRAEITRLLSEYRVAQGIRKGSRHRQLIPERRSILEHKDLKRER